MKPEVSEQLFIEQLFSQSEKHLKGDLNVIVTIERLTGDASTRRYYRIFTNSDSYVVCLDNPSDDENGNLFVNIQKYLIEKNIRVPKVLDTALTKGYILEEDLGDVTLLQHLSTIAGPEEELDVYKNVIDELLKIHKVTLNKKEKTELFPLKFDLDKYMFEIEFSIKYFLKIFLKVEDQDLLNDIQKSFGEICFRLSEQKMVLTHRDFHSRNIMVKNEENVIIDFQDARMGIPQYDLASLLDDCYYELNGNNQDELIEYYFSKLDGSDHNQGSIENFKDLYVDMAIQRVFKAIGSFTYIYHTRKDERYLKYIGFAMEKIKVYLLSNPKYDKLRTLLISVYYES